MRSNSRLALATVVVLLLAFAVPAAHADGEKIAVFTKNLVNPFWEAFRVGAGTAGKQLKLSVENYTPTKPDNIAEQMSEVENAVVSKPAAMVFVPVDMKAMGPAIAKVNAAKIPIVNAVDKAATGNFVTFVGSDDKTLAHATGVALLKAMGGKGNVVIIEGTKGSETSQMRVAGYTQAIKEFPNVKLLASQPGNYVRLTALNVMENLIQTYPQIDGVLAANDAMALGALEALSGAHRKALAVGINATPEAIDAIKKGTMLASGDFNGFKMGCLAMMSADRAIKNQPVPKEINIPATVVDKTNYQPWDLPVNQRSCPKWSEYVR